MKAVVLLSGGADSTTVLAQAMAECKDVHAISINYGQRHKKELECAKEICKQYNVAHTIIDFPLLGSLGGSPLVDMDTEVPAQKDNKQASTVVPYRNTLLITIAAAFAHKLGYDTIYTGPTWEDLANYPDCRPEYFSALRQTLRLGGVIHNLKIITPFIDVKKAEIVSIGLRLGVPYELTWTCYKGQDRPCLTCDACVERLNSFYENSEKDPLLTNIEWQTYLTKRLKEESNE